MKLGHMQEDGFEWMEKLFVLLASYKLNANQTIIESHRGNQQ